MSLVPSEIEYQNDSDAAQESARISGLTVLVMLGILASGFASVGYLAFNEMTGGAPVLANASPDGQSDGRDVQELQNDAPASDTESDESKASPAAGDSVLDDAAEFTVAQSPATSGDAPDNPPSAPTVKPASTPAPTVTYDPAVFGDLPPKPEVNPSPAAPVGDQSDAALDAGADEAVETPAPERQSVAEPADIAPEGNLADSRPEEAIPEPADSEGPGAVTVPEDPPPAETPAEQPLTATTPIDALSGSHVVQLASYRSEEEAMADWRRIKSRLGDYLDGKTYQIERADLGDRGVFHRLRIGPFASSDDAQSYCQGLKDRGQDCLALRR